MKTWYIINDVEKLDTPAFVIYADRLQHNIQLAIKEINQVARLRPHVKTHKMLEVTQLMLDAGITKFKCATIAEAEMLAMGRCEDVLLAYQLCGAKINRFLELQKRYPHTNFSCLVDNPATAQEIDKIARENKSIIRFYIDVNVGMNRTGTALGNVPQLASEIKELSHIKLLGLHAYDGHTQEMEIAERTLVCRQIYTEVYQLKQLLEASGFNKLSLVMGGAPSFPIYAKLDEVECSPGTFVFWDSSYQEKLPEQKFIPAALVLGRVISMPSCDRICLDIGHKAIGAENGLQDRIRFLNAQDLTILGQSEEHLVAKVDVGHKYQIGDILYGLPFHICPTCALYENAIVIRSSKVSETWEVMARKRKITI